MKICCFQIRQRALKIKQKMQNLLKYAAALRHDIALKMLTTNSSSLY